MPLPPSVPERIARRRLHPLPRLVLGTFRVALLVVIAAWSVLLVGWLTLHWAILPHIDQWRGEVESRAGAALGVAVHVGHIEVRSSGWVPSLELTEVSLSDAQGREALRLPRVFAAIAPRSLLAWRLTFAQLYIADAHLVARRDAQGRFHLGGLDLSTGEALDDSRSGDWLFQQREIVVNGGSLRWIDEMRDAPPLELRNVRLVLRNSLRQHQIRLDATPPADWGYAFSLRGRFQQPLLARAGDWRRWSGTAYADLPRADASALGRHVDLPPALRAGVGAFRAWLDLSDGQWRGATVDLALAGVDLKLGEALAPLTFTDLSGRLSAQARADGVHLSAEPLSFHTADGMDWPASRLALAWRQRSPVLALPLELPEAGSVTGGEFSADRLDLAPLATLAERLPLPAVLREQLTELNPQGHARALTVSWTGTPEQPSHFQLRTKLSGLSVAARPSPDGGIGRPGWRNADLGLEVNEAGGQALLGMKDGALILPGVFAEPEVALDRFNARVAWQWHPPKAPSTGLPTLEVRLSDGRFANADTQGSMELRWQTGPGSADRLGKGARYPGQVELSGKLTQARAAAVARYLPLGLPASVRSYVADAVLEGQVPRASFKMRGDLWDFPYTRGREGEFRVAAQVEHLTLAYVPASRAAGVSGVSDAVPKARSQLSEGYTPGAAWPPFTQVRGELVFDRGAMAISHAQAQLWGLELNDVNGSIPDMTLHPALQIDGAGRGPLVDALRFLSATPLDGWTGHVLRNASATGQADLSLGLHIPLDDTQLTTVRGEVALAGNDIQLRSDVPLLARATGRVGFSEQGFSVTHGVARALGGEVAIEGGSQADGAVRLVAQGQASVEALRRLSEWPSVARLAGVMSGQAPYRLQLGFLRGQSEFNVTSSLVGASVDLPAPFHKSAAESLALRVGSTLGPEGGALATRDRLRVELGTQLQAEFTRDLTGESPRPLRGSIGLGTALPLMPASGVAVRAQFADLDADTWVPALRRLWDGEGTGRPAAPAADAGLIPTELSLRAQALTLGGRRLTQVSANVERRGAAEGADVWQVALQSDQAQGQLEWRGAVNAGGSPRLTARLARLSIDAVNDGPVHRPSQDPIASVPETAANLPTLDLVVDQLDWHAHALGRLQLNAGPVPVNPPGEAKEWRVSNLVLTMPEARLSASGAWGQPQRRMALDVTLDLSDSGALVERLGMGQAMAGGKGRITGQLGWPGSPLAPDLSQLAGHLTLAVDSGQFLKIEPGAARLLGVLSLQSLPRRLTLDFRDVFQQGFVFDNISGDLALSEGLARTNNLRIRGVQAVVLVEGQADLRHETQDLHMVVVPEINAGTASLAYAAINPVVGLGTFLAQYVLRGPLRQAGTREFRVSGSWDHPSVDAMERRADAASAVDREDPAVAAPAASAAVR